MALKTRPLVEFRAAVNDLIEKGIEPTATNITKVHGNRWTYERSFKDGYLSRAREEELIKAGWRRVTFNPSARNFRWVKIRRKPATSEGRRVGSQFRVGDTVIPFSAQLQQNMVNVPKTTVIAGYEDGAFLDRDDLPKGATALVLEIGGGDTYLVWDDELVLAEPNTDFPLK